MAVYGRGQPQAPIATHGPIPESAPPEVFPPPAVMVAADALAQPLTIVVATHGLVLPAAAPEVLPPLPVMIAARPSPPWSGRVVGTRGPIDDVLPRSVFVAGTPQRPQAASVIATHGPVPQPAVIDVVPPAAMISVRPLPPPVVSVIMTHGPVPEPVADVMPPTPVMVRAVSQSHPVPSAVLIWHGPAPESSPPAAVSDVLFVSEWSEAWTTTTEWQVAYTTMHDQPGRIEHPGIDSVVIIAAPVVPDFFWEWPG